MLMFIAGLAMTSEVELLSTPRPERQFSGQLIRAVDRRIMAERSRSDKQQRRMSPLGPSEPNASARSVGQVAQLSGNVRQLNHLANEIAGHEAERRTGAGEEWLAATKNDGAEVKPILINKTKVG